MLCEILAVFVSFLTKFVKCGFYKASPLLYLRGKNFS